jgi:hypothetical protein
MSVKVYDNSSVIVRPGLLSNGGSVIVTSNNNSNSSTSISTPTPSTSTVSSTGIGIELLERVGKGGTIIIIII